MTIGCTYEQNKENKTEEKNKSSDIKEKDDDLITGDFISPEKPLPPIENERLPDESNNPIDIKEEKNTFLFYFSKGLFSWIVILIVSVILTSFIATEAIVIYRKEQFKRLPKECELLNNPFFQRQMLIHIANLLIEIKKTAQTNWSAAYSMYKEIRLYYDRLNDQNRERIFPYLDSITSFMMKILEEQKDTNYSSFKREDFDLEQKK